MTLSLTLLLLVLWVNVDLSFSQTECSGLPSVTKAYVPEENKENVYQDGVLLRFTCDFGYISAQSISFTCKDGAWKQVRQGECVPKPCELPDDIIGGEYQLVNGDDFIFGVTIKYVCNDDHQMTSKADTRTCMLNGWSNNLPICEPVRCIPPSIKEDITFEGLQFDDEPISYGNSLRFRCDNPGQFLNGSAEVICSKNGEWSSFFPTCEDFTCAIGDRDTNLIVKGLPPSNVTMKYGHKLQFDCNPKYTLNGSTEVVCSSDGKWSTPLPTCEDMCHVLSLPSNVVITGQQAPVKIGQRLRFQCTPQTLYIHGAEEVVCLTNGQWNAPFPTCKLGPSNCGPPPPLLHGDTTSFPKTAYEHGEEVEYSCPQLYTLQVSTKMKCRNGIWIGKIKCFKACTVSEITMNEHNIVFKYSRKNKLYAKHEEPIEFACAHGRMVGNPRSICEDGLMPFPFCH